ncbi:MAG TPA: alpha/beta fold hydrolase [Chloroflexota bacterium]|nr:alpha/beta fold hydrolase [Chloroflexota bacterium]
MDPRTLEKFVTRATPNEPPWLDRHVFPFESRYVDLDGNRIHYIDEGEGPVLLFLHPSPAWSFIYRDVIGALRGAYRCVALDLPGFGLSRAASDFDFSAGAHARVIQKFVEVRQLEDLVLLGHSQSGPIGLHAAGRMPERLAGLVMVNTFGWRLAAYPSTGRMLRIVSSGAYGLADLAFNATLWYFRHHGMYRRLSAREVAAYAHPFQTFSSRVAHQRTMASLLRGSFLRDVERSAQRLVGLPALILFSDEDDRRTQGSGEVPSWTERWAATFPSHRVVILPHTRHFPQEDAAGAMAAAIDVWHRDMVADDEPISKELSHV